jgi:hypothetical protein
MAKMSEKKKKNTKIETGWNPGMEQKPVPVLNIQ